MSVSCIINLAHVNTLWRRYFTLMREDMPGKAHRNAESHLSEVAWRL